MPLPLQISGTKQWRFAITLTRKDVLSCAYEARGLLQEMKAYWEHVTTNGSEERKFKSHSAARNGSYSSVASSSQARLDEHQLDRNSPFGIERRVNNTSV